MSHHNLQLVALSALWGTSFTLTRFAAPIPGPNLLVMGIDPRQWLRGKPGGTPRP